MPAAHPEKGDIPRIAEGVFFTTPQRLPRGPHGLSRDEVLTIQRERVMIAYTELVAAHGYSATGLREVVARSGTSRSTMYDCFESIEACADAAYERFIAVLVAGMTARLAEGDLSYDMPGVLLAYLGTLQKDLVVARAFQLEFDAAGPEARRRRRAALTGIAELLRAEHLRLAQADPSLDPELPAEVFLGAIYAVRQLSSDMLDVDESPVLTDLLPQLAGWFSRTLRREGGSSSSG